jgi:hypothetical protein
MAEKTLKELRQDKHRFWRVHIRAWETSGFSQNEYCRRNKLRTNQFTYWKTKFKQSPSGQISFVPVPISPTNTVEQSFDFNDSGVSVLLGTIQIRIASNFNSNCLVKVVSALEARP